eukprot:g57611.t1
MDVSSPSVGMNRLEPSQACPLILSLFERTLSTTPQIRLEAENKLNALKERLGFYPCLLAIVRRSPKVAANLRLAAAILFKNGMEAIFSRKGCALSTVEQRLERSFLRRSLLQGGWDETDDKVASQLALSLAVAARYDWPDDWPELLPRLSSLIQQWQNLLVSYRALYTLHQLLHKVEVEDIDNEGEVRELHHSAERRKIVVQGAQLFLSLLTPRRDHCVAAIADIFRANPSLASLASPAVSTKALSLAKYNEVCCQTLQRVTYFAVQSWNEDRATVSPGVVAGHKLTSMLLKLAQSLPPLSLSLSSSASSSFSSSAGVSAVAAAAFAALPPREARAIQLLRRSLDDSLLAIANTVVHSQASYPVTFRPYLSQGLALFQFLLVHSLAPLPSSPEAQTTQPTVVFPNLAMLALNFFINTMSCSSYQLAGSEQRKVLQEFFSAEAVQSLAKLLIHHYLQLQPADLSLMHEDPEQFIWDEEIAAPDQHLRSALLAFLPYFIRKHPEIVGQQVILPAAQKHLFTAEGGDTEQPAGGDATQGTARLRAVLEQDAVRHAMALAANAAPTCPSPTNPAPVAAFLSSNFPRLFQALIKEIVSSSSSPCYDLHSAITVRGALRLLSACGKLLYLRPPLLTHFLLTVANLLSRPASPASPQAGKPGAAPGLDLIVAVAVAKSLDRVLEVAEQEQEDISEWLVQAGSNQRGGFCLQTCQGLLALMARAQKVETKLLVFDVLRRLVRALGEGLATDAREVLSFLVQQLPALWRQASKAENILQNCVLETLGTMVTALRTQSTLLYPAVLPVITHILRPGRPEQLAFQQEHALGLWVIVLRNAPSPNNNNNNNNNNNTQAEEGLGRIFTSLWTPMVVEVMQAEKDEVLKLTPLLLDVLEATALLYPALLTRDVGLTSQHVAAPLFALYWRAFFLLPGHTPSWEALEAEKKEARWQERGGLTGLASGQAASVLAASPTRALQHVQEALAVALKGVGMADRPTSLDIQFAVHPPDELDVRFIALCRRLALQFPPPLLLQLFPPLLPQLVAQLMHWAPAYVPLPLPAETVRVFSTRGYLASILLVLARTAATSPTGFLTVLNRLTANQKGGQGSLLLRRMVEMWSWHGNVAIPKVEEQRVVGNALLALCNCSDQRVTAALPHHLRDSTRRFWESVDKQSEREESGRIVRGVRSPHQSRLDHLEEHDRFAQDRRQGR